MANARPQVAPTFQAETHRTSQERVETNPTQTQTQRASSSGQRGAQENTTASNQNQRSSTTPLRRTSSSKSLHQASRAPTPAEETRCWICHGTQAEEEANPPEAVHGDWKKPCKCALMAHEGCLLEWIADMEVNSGYRARRKIRCPQCRTEIKFRQKSSSVVSVLNDLAKVVDASMPMLAVFGIGSMVFIGCTVYGMKSVYILCGEEFANEIIFGNNLSSVNWTWRLGFGLPLIPVILIGSRTRYLDAALPILPFIFLSHADPLHITFPPSPTVTLALLPYVRGIYNSAWESFIEPIEKKWARTGLPNQAEPEPAQAAVAVQGGANNGVIQGEVRVEHEWNAEIRVDNRIVVNSTSLMRTVFGALLFPGISAIMGSLLMKFPGIRNRLPSKFQRNILGGCLFVVLKDIIRLYFNYKRATQLRSREVLNYERRIRRSPTNCVAAGDR